MRQAEIKKLLENVQEVKTPTALIGKDMLIQILNSHKALAADLQAKEEELSTTVNRFKYQIATAEQMVSDLLYTIEADS